MNLLTSSVTYTGTAGNDHIGGADYYFTTMIGLGGNDTFHGGTTGGVVQFDPLYAENDLDFTGWFTSNNLVRLNGRAGIRTLPTSTSS
jgi:Ca2+-binding RTX toxin-like protein